MKKVSLFIIVFALFGCSKPKQQVTPVDADLKAAFDYQPGTYWIYKDSLSGEIDSFFVTSNIPGAYVNSGGGYSIAQITIILNNYNETNGILDPNTWNYLFQANMIDLKINESTSYDYYIEYAPLVNYPFSYSFSACSGCFNFISGYSTINNIYNSYTINNNVFSTVVEVNDTGAIYSSTSSSHNDWFYICPSAGIIKMRLSHPQDLINRVWEIQRWNIVK